MRGFVASLVVLVAVLFPKVGNAQVYQFRTPPPEVTASNAAWQVNSEPIIIQGLILYPTREYRQFDGQVMAQIGVYQGVPVYADTTLEPWSLVYVPVGRDRMRAFERPRDRELAGTSGSRAASFATRPSSVGTPVTYATPSIATPAISAVEERPVGTGGTIVPSAVGAMATPRVPERVRPTRTTLESIPPTPRSRAGNGVWLQFNGNRWYAAGSAMPFIPERFTPIGEYRGFPVYRDKSGDPDRIWVSVVQDGPLAPYEKR
jgi:hypothetical protein